MHFSICICNFNLCTVLWKKPAVSLGIPSCSISKTAGPDSSHQDFCQKGSFSLHLNSCFFPFFSLDMPGLASHSPGQVLRRNNAKRCTSLLCNDLYGFLFPVALPLLHMTTLLCQKHINTNLYLVRKVK